MTVDAFGPTGWFADTDDEATPPAVWQPVLQVPGMCLPLPIWFDTEEAAVKWISDNVLGARLLP